MTAMDADEAKPVQTPGPSEVRDPETREEIKRAFVWLTMASTFALIVLLIQPLLLILGGVIFAVMLDGGTRLLGRVLPIGRGLRLLIVVVLTIAFIGGTIYMTGVEIAQQAGQLRATVEVQGDRLLQWLTATGMMPGAEDMKSLAREAMGSIGRLTTFLGTAFGALTSLFMIMVIGLFLAMEPRIYERGLQWLLPQDKRAAFKITFDRMGFTMRRLLAWLTSTGMMPGAEDMKSLAREAMGSIGRLTSFLGTAFGALTSLFMIMVIGLFLAMEPRIYERGLQWLQPQDKRGEFKITFDRMGFTMRRLLAGRLFGMFFEGVLTWIALSLCGVPMALILGIITGVLAFIPNIGAFVSGTLMVAVGFSAGVNTGLLAIAVYFIVQTFDGYVMIPLVARKTVDMPPALTLGMQILFGTLFGIFGLALADPMVAMIKVALERRAEQNAPGRGAKKAAG